MGKGAFTLKSHTVVLVAALTVLAACESQADGTLLGSFQKNAFPELAGSVEVSMKADSEEEKQEEPPKEEKQEESPKEDDSWRNWWVKGQSERYSRLDYDYGTGYSYQIFSADGQILEEVQGDKANVYLIEFPGGLVYLRRGCGTNCRYECFFDVETGKKSENFFNLAYMEDGKVVYMDYRENEEVYLVIQDIFDRNVFYKEIHRDFFYMTGDETLELVQFVDGDELRIRYWTKDEELVEEWIDLNSETD